MIFDISFQSGEFYNQTNKGFFDYAIPMITMFSSLIMLYIAVKLYRNLDIRKIFVNKQFEEVLAFAEWIEEFNLQILVYKDLKIVQNYNIDIAFLKSRFNNIKEEFKTEINKPLFFKTDIIPDLKFHQPLTSIYIPKEIKIQLLKFQAYYAFEWNDEKDFFLIIIDTDQPTTGTLDPEYFKGYEEQTFRNFETFITEFLILRKVTHKWLHKYGVTHFEFPVEERLKARPL